VNCRITVFSWVLLYPWAFFDVVTRITNLPGPHKQASQDSSTTSWLFVCKFVCFSSGSTLPYKLGLPLHVIVWHHELRGYNSRSPPVPPLHYQHSRSLGRAIPVPHPPTPGLPLVTTSPTSATFMKVHLSPKYLFLPSVATRLQLTSQTLTKLSLERAPPIHVTTSARRPDAGR
jgi:hypothetical protein